MKHLKAKLHPPNRPPTPAHKKRILEMNILKAKLHPPNPSSQEQHRSTLSPHPQPHPPILAWEPSRTNQNQPVSTTDCYFCFSCCCFCCCLPTITIRDIEGDSQCTQTSDIQNPSKPFQLQRCFPFVVTTFLLQKCVCVYGCMRVNCKVLAYKFPCPCQLFLQI